MLIVLSPAKSLDFETPAVTEISTQPLFNDDAAELVEVAKMLSSVQLSELMDISPGLAKLNVDRFSSWERNPGQSKTKQAILAFNGDVYDGVAADGLNAQQLNYLQQHLRILSGLYGLLRPLDQMQAYRLEMGSRLQNIRGKNLYAFWGNKITNILNEKLTNRQCKSLVNLASEEYFKVVSPKLLVVPVITPIFQDFKNGKYKIISFYAKRARGLMVRYCAEHNVNEAENLKSFNLDGYAFCEEESDSKKWVFRRKQDD
jgi:cytoplasmic iron level regulating protein YaaA (DUF328/UPF0246 family)